MSVGGSDYYSKSVLLKLVINPFKHFWVVVTTILPNWHIKDPCKCTNQFLASFGAFDNFFINKMSQEWGRSFLVHGKARWSSSTWRFQALQNEFRILCEISKALQNEENEISQPCAKFHNPVKTKHWRTKPKAIFVYHAKFHKPCEILLCNSQIFFHRLH